jgi:hypothetical protein
MLGFRKERDNPQGPSPRQPLISRAMKVGLMAEQGRFGNDEPSAKSRT